MQRLANKPISPIPVYYRLPSTTIARFPAMVESFTATLYTATDTYEIDLKARRITCQLSPATDITTDVFEAIIESFISLATEFTK